MMEQRRGNQQLQKGSISYQELRRRKVEEQKNLKHTKGGKKEVWQQVLSKKEIQNERRFREREASFQNTVSFYVSNLPWGCTRNKLWKAFQQFSNLEDAFVPKKRDGAGNCFGFIRFSGVEDVEEWERKLQGVKMEGVVVGVNIARFTRFKNKLKKQPQTNRSSVFDRLHTVHQSNRNFVFDRLHTVQQKDTKEQDYRGNKASVGGSLTYAKAVTNNGKVAEDRITIELPPMITEANKHWGFKSLIGEVKDLEMLEKMNVILSVDLGLGVEVRFHSEHPESWCNWFSRLYRWDGTLSEFERIAWVRITGVPPCLWDRHVFNRIGERCGRLARQSEASFHDKNISENKLAIVVRTGARVSSEINLKWKGYNLKIWVEESDVNWEPEFINFQPELDAPATPPVKSVVVKMHVGVEADERLENEEPCMENMQEEPCTGNRQEDFSSHVSETPHGSRRENDDAAGDLGTNDFIEDTPTKSGPNCNSGAHVNPLDSGLSYVTLRAKDRIMKGGDTGPIFRTPDLNVGEDSDPFSLEEIIQRTTKHRQGETEAQNGDDGVQDSSGRFRPPDQDQSNAPNDGNRQRIFEGEVEDTIRYGGCLGIDLKGFENHVRKIVQGEEGPVQTQ
ncbi:putative RNA recognition motif domain, nucleotide-binding alpha-beta plait domain superfamily [Helianthus annuus]|nr:putative RNA recognition motif domain, nucleotide-binding alpha-beta plait domain superfamily [Helianthus annuus]